MSLRHAARALCAALTLAACSSSGTSGSSSASGAVNAGASSGGALASAGASGMIEGGSAPSGGAAGGLAVGGGAQSGAANDGSAGGEPEGGVANAGTAGNSAESGSGGAAGSAGAGATVGTIVPLYTDPSDASWAAIIAAKNAHPAVRVVAIVNPDSGPGASVDAGYTAGIARLVAAGIAPIGYVSTAYTARGEPAVKTDIDSWHSFYPSLAGIFFDEQSNQEGEDAFYRDVAAYANQHGLAFTVGNPGTGVPASYLGAVDVMLIYEEKGLPTLSSLAGYATEREQYGIIPFGAAFDAAFVGSAKADVAYVYATSDDLPNPWDTLTPYFGQILSALAP